MEPRLQQRPPPSTAAPALSGAPRLEADSAPTWPLYLLLSRSLHGNPGRPNFQTLLRGKSKKRRNAGARGKGGASKEGSRGRKETFLPGRHLDLHGTTSIRPHRSDRAIVRHSVEPRLQRWPPPPSGANGLRNSQSNRKHGLGGGIVDSAVLQSSREWTQIPAPLKSTCRKGRALLRMQRT